MTEVTDATGDGVPIVLPRQLVAETVVEASLDQVWAAVREPTHLRNWFGWEAESLDAEIAHIFIETATVDSDRHSVTFEAYETIADSLELEPTEAGATMVRIVRHNAPAIDWTSGFDELNEGWVSFLQQLRLLLDLHHDEDRQTLYRSGIVAEGESPPSRALGIDALHDKPPGAEFSITLPWGEPLSGTIWHRTAFQTGLWVPALGDGLLIVMDKPKSPRRQEGGGGLLMSCFGLEAETFADLAGRWSAWWTERYTVPSD
ncbi:hypothetical protein GCM10007989_23310 [Devosia pacifica]|uniref:SRPBCC domain-containing protein n=1 Tax=Devosia pacifica TaxID=1335967 RepID=A0A918S6J7_9HYPH|nr:hypothetical protein [Devosia pacifica]GHA26833.1 hypothetical protein GCM10007989_23310 [Devosia pacifica]